MVGWAVSQPPTATAKTAAVSTAARIVFFPGVGGRSMDWVVDAVDVAVAVGVVVIVVCWMN